MKNDILAYYIPVESTRWDKRVYHPDLHPSCYDTDFLKSWFSRKEEFWENWFFFFDSNIVSKWWNLYLRKGEEKWKPKVWEEKLEKGVGIKPEKIGRELQPQYTKYK